MRQRQYTLRRLFAWKKKRSDRNKQEANRLSLEMTEPLEREGGGLVVKGVSKRVIVVKSPDPKIFEQAIFIIREDFAGQEDVCALNARLASEEEWDRWLDSLGGALRTRDARRKALPGGLDPANLRQTAAQFAPMTLLLDNVEAWYGTQRFPADFEDYVKAICKNGYKYNISLFAACTAQGVSSTLPSTQIAALKNASLGIAPGNTLVDCNPWGVEIAYSRENQAMRPGQGFLIVNQQPVRVLLPK